MSLVFRQLEARRVSADAKLNNSARDTDARFVFETSGTGERKVLKPISFGITFVEMPLFTYGLAVADHNLVDGAFPYGNAGVWDWHMSSKGYWIGAFMFFIVTGEVQRLHWHLKFQGEAMRAIAGGETT